MASVYLELFQEIGLSKTESQIYELLLSNGESAVSRVSALGRIDQRNVYDALHRLLDKGLVLEIIQSRENLYQAVDPQKLLQLIDEDREVLLKAMPGMRQLYDSTLETDEVLVYRGIEGWKTYFRDILLTGKDLYVIGGKGWLQPSLRSFLPEFIREARSQKIGFYQLLDFQPVEKQREIFDLLGPHCKFLTNKYCSTSSADIFGDRVTLISELSSEDTGNDSSFVVSINQQMADSFRAWFSMIWDNSPDFTEAN